jgi:hypothetical protein
MMSIGAPPVVNKQKLLDQKDSFHIPDVWKLLFQQAGRSTFVSIDKPGSF